MRRRRRDNPEGQENNERWLITYSDLITLLMIFFVIMYAMSKVDVAKFMTLTQSLAAAMHNENQIPLKDLGTTGLVVPANPQDTGNKKATGESEEDKKMDNLFQQVSQYIQEHHLQENVSIVSQPRGIQITLKDVVLFDTGQATIKPGAEAASGRLGAVLSDIRQSDCGGRVYRQPAHLHWPVSVQLGVVRCACDGRCPVFREPARRSQPIDRIWLWRIPSGCTERYRGAPTRKSPGEHRHPPRCPRANARQSALRPSTAAFQREMALEAISLTHGAALPGTLVLILRRMVTWKVSFSQRRGSA